MSVVVQLIGLEESCRTAEGRCTARALQAWIGLELGTPPAPELAAHLEGLVRGELAVPDREAIERGFAATFARYADQDWYGGSLCEYHADLGRLIGGLLTDEPAALAACCRRSAEELARRQANRRMAQLAHELGYFYAPSLPDVVAREQARCVEARWEAMRSA